MNKKVKNAIEGVKKIANTLTGDAREFADALVGALEELEADAEEHDTDEIMARINELSEQAKSAASTEEVAERIQAVRNEIAGMFSAKKQTIADKLTAAVTLQIANAFAHSHSKKEAESNVMEVLKQNDITGISFGEVVDYALAIKQEDNDELFNELTMSPASKFFVAELDPENASAIAKQWEGIKDGVTEKDIQDLAAEGKTIATKYVYKRQRVPNEVMDEIEAAGTASEFMGSVNTELMRAVQGLIVRAILIGDKVNVAGKRVTTFETIGTTKKSNLFTSVVAPASAGNVSLLDIRKAADKVKFDYKIAVLTSDTKLALITRLYAAGGTPILLSDEELAAQLGVNKVYTRDYIADEEGLHAIVFNPREYWVHSKKELQVAWPVFENNTQNFLYERNCGGAIHGMESCAVVREASASSSKASSK